ncbi:MAG: hypothetical protein HY855_17420 [Burkholderiales bacterium]|nr:hypothetical protein [Burkholderiales bacterium]
MVHPRFMPRSSLLAIGLATALGAQAGHITTVDCNIDAYNLTGHTANDFDILLGGVAPADIGKVFLRPETYFPQVEVTAQTYGALIHYSGREVPHGGAVHIGYEISPSGPVNTIDQYWSWNGTRLGGPAFHCAAPTIERRGDVTNTSGADVWIQRRVVARPAAVDLQADLVRLSAFWTGALVIDGNPIALPQGQTRSHLFDDIGHGSYTLMYDVCADALCQDIRQTVFSSAFVTPEPGAAWLALAGALAMLAVPGRRCRPR